MDSFFSKGFKSSKCKTLLKLTIPRIKLLRNRREMQIKQMRRDIAKLLETGQEATARIRVEHIIREEKMMAAQEIIELFCELIAVRLPIIEVQKECPLDLKEAISSVCFAAPRCADLPELQQVQVLFLGKYGKDFVSAATELRPECGVNRQLIELLSIRAPSPDVKLKVLKEIAEEHELDWDPSASENELLKPHEDLLNGPTQFVSGSKAPIPNEKHEVPSYLAREPTSEEMSDSEGDLDSLTFPEVPKQPIRSSTNTAAAPEMLPFPASALAPDDFESVDPSKLDEDLPKKSHLKTETLLPETVSRESESPVNPVSKSKDKQFVPFISTPPQFAASVTSENSNPAPLRTRSDETVDLQESESPVNSVHRSEDRQYAPFTSPLPESPVTELSERSNRSTLRTKSEVTIDLQDVLAAAHAAAESAERAAAAARSAASLVQYRISEFTQRKNEGISDPSIDNPFHTETKTRTSELLEKPHLGHESSLTDSDDVLSSPSLHKFEDTGVSDIPSYDDAGLAYKSMFSSHMDDQGSTDFRIQRLPSMNDDPYAYPSLFTSHGSHIGYQANPYTDDPRSKSSGE